MIEPTEEDKLKIKDYQEHELPKYAEHRASLATDIVVLRPVYDDRNDGEWRKNPQLAVEMLLIKRGQWPYEGSWALPGGFVRRNETAEECAIRELEEETAVRADKLIHVGVFADPYRDMRTRVVSCAFVYIMERGQDVKLVGGSDAREATWVRIVNPQINSGMFNLPIQMRDGRYLFTISGTCKKQAFLGGIVTHVNECKELAFDHGEIIASALMRMLGFVDHLDLMFYFLPDKFTLAECLAVYAYLEFKPISEIDLPNFRRQLLNKRNPLVEVCPGEHEETNSGHRPAKLYRQKVQSGGKFSFS